MIRRFHPLASFLALAVLSFAAPPAAHAQRAASADAWRTDVPCTAGSTPAIRDAGAVEETEVPGCARAYCVYLPDSRRVCSCAADSAITIRMEAPGSLHTWEADYSLAGSPESLRVLLGDLDGDGLDETIVSEWQDMSNGLGIRYYALRIFSGRHPSRLPVEVAVRDFDPEGSFVRPAGGGECRLLDTRWTELSDPRRGEGMYFVGQWMRYRDGRLEHDTGRPVVARRLLDSFADARGTTPGAPFAYLRHPDARAHAEHGLPTLPPRTRTEEGTFRSVRGDSITLDLPPDVVSAHTLGDFHREDGWTFITRLIDGATGRPYPDGYVPADEQWLEGRPVRLLSHSNSRDRTVYLVVANPSAVAAP
jgi:hypothetical protein